MKFHAGFRGDVTPTGDGVSRLHGIPIEHITEYDFLPMNDQNTVFKDPKDFTNILFKRLSYHYEDEKGNKSDFVIAKGIPPRLASSYFNIPNFTVQLEQEARKIEQNESATSSQNKIQLLEGKQVDDHQTELENLLGIKKQSRRPSLLDRFVTKKEGDSFSVPGFTEICKIEQDNTETVKLQAARKILENQLQRIQQSNHNFELQQGYQRMSSHRKTGSASAVKDRMQLASERPQSVGEIGFMRQTQNTRIKQKEGRDNETHNQSFYSSFLSRKHQQQQESEKKSTVDICKKLSRIYPEKQDSNVLNRSQTRKRSVSHRSSISAPDTETDMQFKHSTKVKTKKSFGGFRRPVDFLPIDQKTKFHDACLKFQNISSFNDYISFQVNKDNLDAQFDTTLEDQQNKDASAIKARREARTQAINRKNIILLKQEQHLQLLKVVDAFQQRILDSDEEKSSQNDSPNAASRQSPSQKGVRPTSVSSNVENEQTVDLATSQLQGTTASNRRLVLKQKYTSFSARSSPTKQPLLGLQQTSGNMEELSTRQKALNLKTTYSKMKNESAHNIMDSFTMPQIRLGLDRPQQQAAQQGESLMHLRLSQKNKLYSCVEEGEDEIELKYSKPKKFIKRQIVNTAGKGKKKQSFVESVRDQENQLSFMNLKQRFGRSIAKLFEFLQLCIRLKVCIDDIIEDKVFTTKAYERNGSYVFFKMVKQNKLESVRSQINECRWRIFDIDHLHMTPLHIAAIKGFKELAFYLIDQSADLEAEDIDNKTPVSMNFLNMIIKYWQQHQLWYALKHKQFEIARYLLMNRANPWANDNFRYYDIVDDPDMRASLKVARQLWILMKITSFKKRMEFWNSAVNRILDPIFYFEDAPFSL